MGLDLVEFLIAVETAFDLTISDEQAGGISSPRELIAHLATCVPLADAPSARCQTQRAFYRLRAACQRQLDVPRSQLRPDTSVVAILTAPGASDQWRRIQDQLGATAWPHLRQNPLMIALRGVDRLTLGQTARHLAQWHPALLKAADEGWTLDEIEHTVIAILEELHGIDIKAHSLDAHFVTDLLLD
ncbi:MAG TPA: hypothetical protein VD886_11220 [Herpetosiphonaceae bacterium]|nr:hypothetical protein [Herpetosiphonaceae bacterium]